MDPKKSAHAASVVDSASRGYESPRSRGRGRGGQFSHPNSGSTTPGRGRESPRGRGRGSSDYLTPGGRGRGLGGSKLRPDAPLSSLLYQERPLLRPVIFVRSVYTRTLFEEEEEILQAVVEQVGQCSSLFLVTTFSLAFFADFFPGI